MRDKFDKEQDNKQVEMLLNSLDMYNNTIAESRFKNKDVFSLVPLFSARGGVENELLTLLEKMQEKDNKENNKVKNQDKIKKPTLKVSQASNVLTDTCTKCNNVEEISAITAESITNIAIRLTNEKIK